MPLLLWSGGCDSTLLLHDLLAQRDGNLSPDQVRAISIRHPQVNANDENRKARDTLAGILGKRFYPFVRSEVEIRHGDESFGIESDGPQSMMWTLHAALYLRPAEDLYIGYVRGDDIWHYRNKLFEAFDVLQWLGHRTGKLILPLEWETKPQVLSRLKKAALYRHCWYCEDPVKGRKCGKCGPCKTHAAAVWQLSQGGV